MIEWATWFMFKAFGKVYCWDHIIFYNGEVIKREITGTHHTIYEPELLSVHRRGVETLIVGTGWQGNLKVDPMVEYTANKLGFKIIAIRTPDAIREFNKRLKTGEKVALLLHITC